MPEAPPDRPGRAEPPPPVLGSWRRLYAVVVGNLVALILFFWAFTVAFR